MKTAIRRFVENVMNTSIRPQAPKPLVEMKVIKINLLLIQIHLLAQMISFGAKIKQSPEIEVCSALFVFKQEVSMISYMPKKNKPVTLISSTHDDKAVGENDPNMKQEIINYWYYSKMKSGVDVMDKNVRSYSVKM